MAVLALALALALAQWASCRLPVAFSSGSFCYQV